MHALPRFALVLTTALAFVAPHGIAEEAAEPAKKSDEIVAIYDLRDLGDRARVLVERLRHLEGVSNVDSVAVAETGGQAAPSYSITVRATHEAHAALARKLAGIRKPRVLEKARGLDLSEVQQRAARLQAAMSEAEIAGRRQEFEKLREELMRMAEKVRDARSPMATPLPAILPASGAGAHAERRAAELEHALGILERHGNREAAKAVRQQLEEARQEMRRHREGAGGRHHGDGPQALAALHEEVRALRKDVQDLTAALRVWMAREAK